MLQVWQGRSPSVSFSEGNKKEDNKKYHRGRDGKKFIAS